LGAAERINLALFINRQYDCVAGGDLRAAMIASRSDVVGAVTSSGYPFACRIVVAKH